MASDNGEVGREINQQFEARGSAQSKSGVGAVDHPRAISRAQINSILTLQTALRYHNTRIGDVGPIGSDIVCARRTILSIGRRLGRTQTGKCGKTGHQPDL
jgi:hypothetical protein